MGLPNHEPDVVASATLNTNSVAERHNSCSLAMDTLTGIIEPGAGLIFRAGFVSIHRIGSCSRARMGGSFVHTKYRSLAKERGKSWLRKWVFRVDRRFRGSV